MKKTKKKSKRVDEDYKPTLDRLYDDTIAPISIILLIAFFLFILGRALGWW